ncbi:hypothetical protein RIF29_13774 [Crotalaria pallida]|uniref:Uncharacterized protein n=1 Tax=Crotalaria pallida TaxID=3830 RepID=A0AAN9IQ54_CROPI
MKQIGHWSGLINFGSIEFKGWVELDSLTPQNVVAVMLLLITFNNLSLTISNFTISMANSRIARLFMEVAPPQYISVMRHRTTKMLDTISEEEKEMNSSNNNDSVIISPPKHSSPTPLSFASASSAASASATIAASTTPNPNSKYFLREVHRSLSTLNN